MNTPKLHVVSTALTGEGPGMQHSLERTTRLIMERGTGTVNSSSGMTAALAVNYCERTRTPYRLTAQRHDGEMFYVVEKL